MTKKEATKWLTENLGTYLDHNGTEGKFAVFVPQNGEMLVAYADTVEDAVFQIQTGRASAA